MKWGIDWRKLYRNPSSEWLALPLSVRGLGDELLRYAEDDGRIFVGDEDPIAALARRMGAHPTERKWLAAGIAHLTKDGFCRIEGGYLTIRNFVDAQSAVSPSAVRMRRHRASTGSEPTVDRPSTDRTPTSQPHGHQPKTDGERADVSPQNSASASVTVTQPIEEKRLEEKRDPLTPEPDSPKSVAAVTCSTVERPNDLDALSVLDALKRGAQGSFEHRCSAALQLELVRAVNQSGFSLDELERAGREVRERPPSWFDGGKWTVAVLLGRNRDGAVLTSLVVEANARAEREAAERAKQGEADAWRERWRPGMNKHVAAIMAAEQEAS